MSRPALQIYSGRTVHARHTPFAQRFSYRVDLIDIDIDRLEEADRTCRLFSVDRPNLFSFRRRDHGDRTETSLRPWAERTFERAGIALDGGPIRLMTFPRHAFYKFAPISLWFGYDRGETPRGVVYEVNNTFGDTHAYVAPIDGELCRHEAAKALHVSPFFDVRGEYAFTLRKPGERLGLVVENRVGEERTHTATLLARRISATDGAFARLAVASPLATWGVSAGIHWEALKIWLKGARYRSRPAPANDAISNARPLATDSVETSEAA